MNDLSTSDLVRLVDDAEALLARVDSWLGVIPPSELSRLLGPLGDVRVRVDGLVESVARTLENAA